MLSPLSISLRPWPTTETPQSSLPFLISRINEQRGSFRNVSETALEEEIRLAQTSEGVSGEPSKAPGADGADEVKPRREVISESREEILKQVAKAHMESAHALDFVSLLLSKHTPRQAELTLSPYLKQNLPIGTLGAEILQTPQKPDSEIVHDEKISIGWKLNALASAADSLLKTASRLEQEIERETKYWGQVLAVKEQGWPICRLPRERHTLGVRYGFAEAHTDFRDRGLAALRRDEDGNINLDCGSASSGNRVLRVSMVQPNMPALSSVRSSERNCEELPVETLLLRARDSIYDEELYHELHREARNLTNQGVRSNDGMVSIPYDHNKRIEIDLLSCLPDECVESESNTCAGIAISLRILLSHAHRQNLRRRSQPPPPVREGKIPRPTYAIITPVLEHLQHDLQVKSTVQLLSDLRATCMRAGFDLRFHNPTPPYGLENLAAEAAPSDFHATEGLINQLTKLRQSTIVILLPTGLTELQVGMQTSLQPHLCGTGYQCTIVSSALESYISRMPSTIQFPSFAALEGHVLHLLQLDIVGLVASRQDGINGWTIVSPHDGQASRANRNTERSDRIWITVQRNSIRLKWKRGHKRRNDEGTVKWDSRTPTAVDADNSPSLIATIDDIFGDGI